jgi:hypothetical protein
MNCVILQPSYIPWRGYFDQIRKADLFIFYDDVQYDKRGWRNRNRIKTLRGPQWLSIPVYNKGAQVEHIPINEIKICWDDAWNQSHWKSIDFAYKKAPHFSEYAEKIEAMYSTHPEYLADFTIDTTIQLARMLGISHTQFKRSSEIPGITGAKTERLVQILKAVGATHYISGPSAQDYIDNVQFEEAGITLEYMAYHYPEYPQLYPPYDPQVTVLDLMFMTGDKALTYFEGQSVA